MAKTVCKEQKKYTHNRHPAQMTCRSGDGKASLFKLCFASLENTAQLIASKENQVSGVSGRPAEISVPGRDILVCQPRCHIKHDDSTLPVNVVAISQPAKLLLACCVPAIEAELPSVCGEV